MKHELKSNYKKPQEEFNEVEELGFKLHHAGTALRKQIETNQNQYKSFKEKEETLMETIGLLRLQVAKSYNNDSL